MNWTLRTARMDDVPALEILIPLSVRSLQAPHYSTAQMDAALGTVFGVDEQLIADGTHFVAVASGQIVGCGGWSMRKTLYGASHGRHESGETHLDPEKDPARIRAFFVHPEWARQGIGRAILETSEKAIIAAGFNRAELVATLAGVPLYAKCGYLEVDRFEISLTNGLPLPAVRMGKVF